MDGQFFDVTTKACLPSPAGQQVSGIRVGVWTGTPGSLVMWAQEEQEDGIVVREDVGERVKPIAI